MSGRTERGAAGALALAGVLFVVYPVLRPWGDTDWSAGRPFAAAASAFAAPQWPVAHLAGALGFVLLPAGLLALRAVVGGRLATWALVLTGLGAGLVLPYYGAEAFALHVVGERFLATGDAGLADLVDAIRNSPLQITVFGVGLVLLAVGSVVAAVAGWRSGVLSRWAAVPLAVAFVLYLPQFYAGPAVRIAHGVLVGIACVVLAVPLARRSRGGSRTTSPAHANA